MASWSKAPRGLFVLLWDGRIFTACAISPSPLLRQRSDRDAFRAGRNLPDKEFRYLRTVIVTAAVHWGFGSRLSTSPLNLPALGRRQPLYVHGFVFAETCVFAKQSPEPGPCASPVLRPQGTTHVQRTPSSEGTGSFLPSSLTRDHSSTWVYSTSLPVSDCGTVTVVTPIAAFRACPGPAPLALLAERLALASRSTLPGTNPGAPYQLGRRSSRRSACRPAYSRWSERNHGGSRLSTACPSPTARALGLGPPTPPRIARAAEPSGIRCGGFSPPKRYSFRHSHLIALHSALPRLLRSSDQRSPTARIGTIRTQCFGALLEPRWIVGAGQLDQ
jgi:hypothetical protein